MAEQKAVTQAMKPTKILLLAATMLAPVSFVSAQTWTQTGAPDLGWGSVTISADGTKLAAIAGSGSQWNVIWNSTNSGMTWTSNSIQSLSPAGRFTAVAMSASGEKQAAVANANAIYTSTNYGATWASNSVPSQPWFKIASSADGIKLVAAPGSAGNGSIYFSTDSGQTWTRANAPDTNWVSVASSANGSNWVASVEAYSPPGGSIYTSTNCGLDWTLTAAPNLQWLSVASSADGTKLLAAGTGESDTTGHAYIYTSTNSGATWISNVVPNAFWSSVASSADGRTLAVAAIFDLYGGPGFIYTSTNSGVAWISNSVPSQSWHGIALSADGGTLVAAGGSSFSSGGIYILQTAPAPELNILHSTSNLSLSWLIPSTNFVVQQSSNLASWTDLTNPPALNLTNLQNEVTLSPSNCSSFYRLKTP